MTEQSFEMGATVRIARSADTTGVRRDLQQAREIGTVVALPGRFDRRYVVRFDCDPGIDYGFAAEELELSDTAPVVNGVADLQALLERYERLSKEAAKSLHFNSFSDALAFMGTLHGASHNLVVALLERNRCLTSALDATTSMIDDGDILVTAFSPEAVEQRVIDNRKLLTGVKHARQP